MAPWPRTSPYGVSGASDEAIREAARQAECLTSSNACPWVLPPAWARWGQKPGGRQRQRPALARAILKNPAIPVLDEATSAVDNETEAAIQRSLDVVSRGRTTVVIAHRLSTVRHAHCIHVMEHGRIVERAAPTRPCWPRAAATALWRLQTGERSVPVAEVPAALNIGTAAVAGLRPSAHGRLLTSSRPLPGRPDLETLMFHTDERQPHPDYQELSLPAGRHAGWRARFWPTRPSSRLSWPRPSTS